MERSQRKGRGTLSFQKLPTIQKRTKKNFSFRFLSLNLIKLRLSNFFRDLMLEIYSFFFLAIRSQMKTRLKSKNSSHHSKSYRPSSVGLVYCQSAFIMNSKLIKSVWFFFFLFFFSFDKFVMGVIEKANVRGFCSIANFFLSSSYCSEKSEKKYE